MRLDNVWGVGGGIRPVKYLVCTILSYVCLYFVKHLKLQVKKIILLLKEYLCSQDVTEASRCLLDLEVWEILTKILNTEQAQGLTHFVLGASLPPRAGV